MKMIMWLDHLIFGNGRGLKQPGFDGVYYWLNGEIYIFSGWFGSQLASFQWTHPSVQERRTLCNRVFKPFSSKRRWGRVIVSWGMVELSGTTDEQNNAIRRLQYDLSRL